MTQYATPIIDLLNALEDKFSTEILGFATALIWMRKLSIMWYLPPAALLQHFVVTIDL